MSCGFDGGDCPDLTAAYGNCVPTGTRKAIDCSYLFNNSRCDVDCNTSGCLFDGGDCQKNSVSMLHSYLRSDLNGKNKEILEVSGAPFHREL